MQKKKLKSYVERDRFWEIIIYFNVIIEYHIAYYRAIVILSN